MTEEARKVKQPDILEVIADLSNDEVFTPPRVANDVLDLLPPEVWANPDLRWLDPGCKTGVFLREVTRRLLVGLKGQFASEAQCLEHILHKMVFGVGVTELTALMSRRTLYCSKNAAGERAAVRMPIGMGNVWFDRVEHAYNEQGRCTECGATRDQMERDNRENYAYAFIHKDGRKKLKEATGMKFDVVVGNPPYQMTGGGGGTNDTPLYHYFVEQAKALNPRYMTMIIPSRWMAGGRGLDEFRTAMLRDSRIRKLVDYTRMDMLFPGSADFEGGISYFLWDRDTPGACEVTLVQGEDRRPAVLRKLDEYDIFIRDDRALGILKKTLALREPTMEQIISGDTPFGLATNFTGGASRPSHGKIMVHASAKGKRVVRWIDGGEIAKNASLVDVWKVLLPEAYGERGATPAFVLGPPLVAGPGSVCTQTYLVAGPLTSEDAAKSLITYVRSRFFRFLVSLRKITQHALRSTYSWVPQQIWDRAWTDAALYEKYGITAEEQAYIAEMVKEMPA